MRLFDRSWMVALALMGLASTAHAGARGSAMVPPRNISQPHPDAADRRGRVRLFARQGLVYPAPVLHLRAFKHEAELELWAGQPRKPLRLVRTYPICASSGKLGPKRWQGDLQVPEGFYRINLLNPRSRFHRSMRISYPNRSDRLLGRRGRLGGQIMIHGGCATIGCIPIEDRPIEQLFNIVRDSWRTHGRLATIHIFPLRMNEQGMRLLRRRASNRLDLLDFWLQLQRGFVWFEKTRRIPRIRIGTDGRYQPRPRRAQPPGPR